MMRLYLSCLMVLTALAWPFQALAGDDPALDRVRAMLETGLQPVRIVCFGDSVTGIYYHTGGRRAWPDMLDITLRRAYPKARIKVFNAGVSGHTSGNGLARLDRDVISRKPHLVAVMFGLNDITHGDSKSYRDNLRTMVRHCRESGAAVVLCTLNSVYPHQSRPMAAVTEFSQIVRDLGEETKTPVADCFQAYEDVRRKAPAEWMLLMNEYIHPSLEGHKLFAKTVAEVIVGSRIGLADIPPAGGIQFTLARLKAKQPVSVIAMAPYDRMIGDVLTELFPGAQVDVTPWPVEGQSLSTIAKWSKGIRDRKPNLVVLAVPASAEVPDEKSFIYDYHDIASGSVAYVLAKWDLLPILPSVTDPAAAGEPHRMELARRIIDGVDVEYIDRKDHDVRPARQILLEWIAGKSGLVPAAEKTE